jgi:hypothetical protein
MLSTSDAVTYQEASKVATQEIAGYDNVNLFEPSKNGSGLYESSAVKLDTNDNLSHGANRFGLPIYHPLVLEAVPDTEANEDLLLDGAIVEFNRTKDIVITKIQGQTRSVKEHINNGDYMLSVSGVICNTRPGYPFEEIELYKAFMDVEKPIKVVHDVLNAFGINSIVITDHKQPKGEFTNAQSFAFNAIDDEPLIIT